MYYKLQVLYFWDTKYRKCNTKNILQITYYNYEYCNTNMYFTDIQAYTKDRYSTHINKKFMYPSASINYVQY